MMGKVSHSCILSFKCGFGIGYSIGQKYQPIWVSVSVLVSDLNQIYGFGRTLVFTNVRLVVEFHVW